MSLGQERLAWHEDQAAGRQAFVERKDAEKSSAAWFGMPMHELIAGGPRNLRLAAREITDWEHRFRLLDVAGQLDIFWLEAKDMDAEGRAAEAQVWRRNAVAAATGWSMCPGCDKPYRPGDRNYTRCYRCSQIEYSSGSLACVICGRRHSMKFGACFMCKQAGWEGQATFTRSLVNRRDDYACAMCGAGDTSGGDLSSEDDEDATSAGKLEIDHVLPLKIGGRPDQWNMQTLCTGCKLVKGDRYGDLDERARLLLMEAYLGPLYDYLHADERERLDHDMRWTLTEDGSMPRGEPAVGLGLYGVPQYGQTVSDIEGLLNVRQMWPDANIALVEDRSQQIHTSGLAVRNPETGRYVNSVTGLDYGPAKDPCKGHVHDSYGRQPCSNLVNYRIGILCDGCT